VQSAVGSAGTITSNAAISLISRDSFANTVLGTATINVNATGQVIATGAASPAVILTSGSSLNIAGLVSASSAGAIDYRGTAGGSVAVNVLSGGTVRSSGSAAIIGNTGAMNLTVAGTVDAGARQPPSS
jgi:hypothetical protein